MSVIDEVKARLDLVAIVEESLPLKKSGRNFTAPCPFHPDKVPSFYVYPERQSWRCYGCNQGGDVFHFVMKRDRLSFGEALKLLAQRAGVALAPKSRPSTEKYEGLYRANEAAAQFYHQRLLQDAEAGKAREFLAQRKVIAETVEKFLLGYSPSGWQALKEHLLSLGLPEADLVEAGLLGSKEGRSYDLFRGRLMIPIRDLKGRVLGFGGRVLDGSDPKYLNSPQTPIFDKGRLLFGLDKAREALREKGQAVIVEGYMDVLLAHQQGFRNVLATMGTALSPRQIALLQGLAKDLVLALDADVAGEEATYRAVGVARDSLDKEKLPIADLMGASQRLSARISVMVLPPGQDPDDVLREGPEEWSRLLGQALPLMDYLINRAISRVDLRRPEGRAAVQQEVLPFLKELSDEVERQLYLQKLASLIGVSDRTLAAQAARLKRNPKKKERVEEEIRPYPGDRLEEYLLSLLLRYPELRARGLQVPEEHLERSENREALLAWKKEGFEAELDPALQEHVQSLLERPLPPLEESERSQALEDCLLRLKRRHLRNLKLQESQLLAEAEVFGSVAERARNLDARLRTGEPPQEAWERLQQQGIIINEQLYETEGRGR